MKRQFTQQDGADFVGAMQFLESNWGAQTHYSVDSETGKGTIQIWMPGSQAVLHLETIDVRRLRVVDPNPARFKA